MDAHKLISFTKSGFRIAGYFLILWSIPYGVAMLVFSELLGIFEEMVV